MQLDTTKFGTVEFEPRDLIFLEQGTIAAPGQRQWLLLADAALDGLWWLQSVSRANAALPVTSPSRLKTGRVKVSKSRISSPDISSDRQCVVLWQLYWDQGTLVVDQRQPIVIDVLSRRGQQVRIADGQLVRCEPSEHVSCLRKSA